MMMEINGLSIASNIYDAFVSVYGLYSFEKSVIHYTSEYNDYKSNRMLTMIENDYLLEGATRSALIDVIKLLTRKTCNDLIVDSDFVYDKYVIDFEVELNNDVNYDDETEYIIRKIEERKFL